MAIVNQINLTKKLQTTLQAKKFVGFVQNAANTRFVAAKQNMLEELAEHPVSKEIEEACANPAITQSDLISKGNIASAMGFFKGSNPVEVLSLYLKNNTTMDSSPKITLQSNKVVYNFPIITPSKEELYQSFPAPGQWTTRSWLDMIENGISFLSKYIFQSKGFKKVGNASRSTTGLQLKRGNVSNEASFNPKLYITEILNNFKAYFKK